MKVLIVSHNSFSHTVNMGKTLLSYFGDFMPDEVAQFYIHSEIPTVDTVCTSYFRFTDRDAMASLFTFRELGVEFNKKDIQVERNYNRTDTGVLASFYQKGTERTSAIYLLRSLLWSLSKWKTKHLKVWLEKQKPDVIFFASSDYIFMYQIALFMADYCKVPLVIACVDDYYIYNANDRDLLGKLHHKLYTSVVRKVMARSACIFTICDAMNREYHKLFSKTCYTLHTSVFSKLLPDCQRPFRVSYIGNLDFRRYNQLIDIAKALYSVTDGKFVLDVYSGETKTEILDKLRNTIGVRYNGRITANEVLKVMSESVLVVHTECFDRDIVEQVRYSVSTKIAESLMYGPCLLAYGPQGIASIDYLDENNAAHVITSKDTLEDGLREIIGNAGLRSKILANARALAQANHRTEVNSANVRKWLEEAVYSKE